MKMRTSSPIRTQKIRSVQDLKLEKSRLKIEMVKYEEKIKGNYRNIVDALTLKNLLQHLSYEISTTTSAVSTAVSLGKTLFGKLRKKKKNKEKPTTGTSTQSEESPAE
jgi:hypothetical protein